MASIFDFLKRLFSRPRPSARPPAMSFGGAEPAAETAIAATTPQSPPAPEPESKPDPIPLVTAPPAVADEVEDDAEEEEEPEDLSVDEEFDDDDPLAPDPFVSPDAPAIEALSPDAVSVRRAEAMTLALAGEHRVFLVDAAGPGTLAEALNLLAQQGKVEAEFRDDETEGPYLLYRVVGADADQPPPSAL